MATSKLILLMVVSAAACAAQSGSGSLAVARRDVRALTILPGSVRACPGEVISARYVVSLNDGSTKTLGASEAASLVRTGVAVTPRADGAWVASAEPLESAVTGFRLRATLATDTAVHADTVVAPRYDCRRTPPIVLPISHEFNATQAHVRIGTFPTPFYDSIVVVVVEMQRSVVSTTVLGPSEMRSGTLTVQALGKDGRAGRAGRSGRSGAECTDGEQGDDGVDGESGQPGGQVDFIIEDGAPWLADLIVVQNAGGRGGAGGQGGRGGPAGPAAATRTGGGAGGSTGGRCTARAGRPGANGHAGANAGAGPASRTSFVTFPLLWPGSPIWSESAARAGLEALIAYEAKARR